MHDVGSRLKEMREKRGLTQKALAKRINKSTSAISGYESNVQTPPTDVLISISQALHVPFSYFVDLACENYYSSSGFSAEEKEVLDLLFEELTAPSHKGSPLSARQIDIIGKLIQLFQRE